jgi:hypothetical protein
VREPPPPTLDVTVHPLQLNARMPLEEALAELDNLRPGEQFSYRALAKKTWLFTRDVDPPAQGSI